ncbi:MAG: hypothetical protein AAB019_01240 [Planctomycetota bacterium]
MKWKRLLIGIVIWLAAFWLSPQIFPGLFNRGYDSISGATSRGGSGGYELGGIEWVTDYKKALAQAEEKSKPLLIYFKAHNKDWLASSMSILKNIPDIINDVTYLVVILNRDEDGNYTEDMSVVKEFLKKKNKDDEPAGDALTPLKEEIALAIKYKVTELPQLVWCDHFGNKLQSGDANILASPTPGALRREARSIKETQVKLQQQLTEQYEPLRKKFENQKTEGIFSTFLIHKLQKIAVYNGYDPCKKSREYLAEINTLGEEKLKRLNQINPDTLDQEDKALIIDLMTEKLEEIINNYPTLPVSEKASGKINELAGKLNSPKKEKDASLPNWFNEPFGKDTNKESSE